ncbi:MAG TPA: TolC family protein [Saprospiraceae bacterium]|nr:TolC family protein [Saprospiraceae bacterium]
MKIKFLIAIIVLVISNKDLEAQQKLTKKEVLNQVASNNLNLDIIDQEYNIALADYNQSSAMFLPDISASYTGIYTDSPLNVFGSKLNQAIVGQQDFNPVLLNDPDGYHDFSAKLELKQPILNFDKKYEREAAKVKLDAIKYQKVRAKEQLQFEAEKMYMQLQLTHKMVTVLEQAVKTAEVNRSNAVNFFDQGYIQKSDVLSADIRVNDVKNQLFVAKINVNNLSDGLKLLMNSRSQETIVPKDSLITEDLALPDSISHNRADIMAMNSVTQAYDNLKTSAKKTLLPRLNAFASYETHDKDVLAVDGGGYLLGMQLHWNIFDGNQRKAKIQRHQAQVNKTLLETQNTIDMANTELSHAIRMREEANEKLNLYALAVKQSEEYLRIKMDRFQQGLEKYADVLIAETSFSQKQLAYYQAIFELNYAQAYIKYLAN